MQPEVITAPQVAAPSTVERTLLPNQIALPEGTPMERLTASEFFSKFGFTEVSEKIKLSSENSYPFVNFYLEDGKFATLYFTKTAADLFEELDHEASRDEIPDGFFNEFKFSWVQQNANPESGYAWKIVSPRETAKKKALAGY